VSLRSDIARNSTSTFGALKMLTNWNIAFFLISDLILKPASISRHRMCFRRRGSYLYSSSGLSAGGSFCFFPPHMESKSHIQSQNLSKQLLRFGPKGPVSTGGSQGLRKSRGRVGADSLNTATHICNCIEPRRLIYRHSFKVLLKPLLHIFGA
jgi:hypothetical protein